MSNTLTVAQISAQLDRILQDPIGRQGDAARIKKAILLLVQGIADPEGDTFNIVNLFPIEEETEDLNLTDKLFAVADPETAIHYYVPESLLKVFINYWRKIYNEADPPELVELLYDEGLVHILRGLRLSYVDAEDEDNPLYSEADATSEDAITELTDSRLALIWDPADGKVFPRKLHPEAFAGVEIVNLGVEGSYSLYTGKDIDGKHQIRKIRLGANLSGVVNDDEELEIDGADVVSIGDVDSVEVYAGKNGGGAHQIRKVIGGAGIAASINANDEVEIAKKYTAIYLDHAASHDLAIVPGSIFFIKVAGNTTIANPTEFPHCHFQIILENVDGGTYTVSWGNKWVFEEDTPPAFPTTIGFCLVMDNVAKENHYIWPDVTGPFNSPGATDPPAIPVVDYFALFSFLKLEESATKSLTYKRDADSAEADLGFLGTQSDIQSLYDFLKASTPISAFATATDDVAWSDQSGQSLHLINSSVNNSRLLSSKFNGKINLLWNNGSGWFESVSAGFSSGLQKCTITTLCRIKRSGAESFVLRVVSNTLATGAEFCSIRIASGKWQTLARSVVSDSLQAVTSAGDVDFQKWYILQSQIDFVAGTMEFFVDEVSEGTNILVTAQALPASSLHRLQLMRADNLMVSYVSVRPLTDEATRLEESTYLKDAYSDLLSTTVKTGANVHDLFDVIISPDRYNYSPYAVLVRESGANAQQIISHDNSTGLFDETAFDTFVGANSGFAVNMRNQQNPEVAFTQSTAARQLLIVKNIFNGRAAFQGNAAARRSIQNTAFAIDTKALHYYYFAVVEIGTISTQSIISVLSGNTTRMVMGVNTVSGNLRLNMYQTRTDADSLIISNGINNLTTSSKVLLSWRFDYENGVMEGYVNNVQEINNTSAYISSGINGTTQFTLGNYRDTSGSPFDGKMAGGFFRQGEMGSAQFEQIRLQLMIEFGIS